MSGVRIGCCGFSVSRKKYYEFFDVVEIQQTFYDIPKIELARKWRDEAPHGFEFTIKAWQLITHPSSSPTYKRLKRELPKDKLKNYGFFKPTDEVFSAWDETREFARALGARIIVFQCPASFKPTSENKKNLENFFNSIERDEFIFAWEARGDWCPDEIKELCQKLNLIDCVDPFKRREEAGEITYWRLHGKTGYRYKYSDEELSELLNWVNEKSSNAGFYVMFNNTEMWDDARRFKELTKNRRKI